MNSLRTRILGLACLIVLLGADTCFAVQTNGAKTRPAGWATKLDRRGLANFYEVSTNLYRGAQPSAQGMRELKDMGIRTVLNLRSFHSDNSLIARGDLKLARLHMEPWRAKDEDAVQFLKIVTDTNNLPVFVHCQRGADRTGMLCAVYRVVVCGWTKDAAVQEMKGGGFAFNPAWQNLVNYVERLNADALKKRAGIADR
jgi:protein tyrosine/serine phosphatase